jgi:CspA family cold shock protein
MPTDNSCNNCGGTGLLDCNKCGGSGYITCFKCEGSGHVHYIMRGFSTPGHGIPGGQRSPNLDFRRPEPISVDGSRECFKCEGTGRLSCRKCDGTGSVECRKCGGTGIYERPARSSGSDYSPSSTWSDSRSTGTVKFYNRDKGFGFIDEEGSDEDVHVSARNLNGVSELRKGDRVSFVSRSGSKGKWAADVEKE